MKLKLLTLLLALVTLCSVIPVGVSAANVEETVSPCWSNTGMISCKVGFPDDGYGYAEAHVMGHPTANRIKADVYVYRQVGSSWVYVAEEHETVDKCSLTISCKFVPVDGAYYRADYTFVVTKNGTDETITQTKYKTNS